MIKTSYKEYILSQLNTSSNSAQISEYIPGYSQLYLAYWLSDRVYRISAGLHSCS